MQCLWQVKGSMCHVLQDLGLASQRAALYEIHCFDLFHNNHKAQVVCYIYFVKVKAEVSKSAAVITKKTNPGLRQDV